MKQHLPSPDKVSWKGSCPMVQRMARALEPKRTIREVARLMQISRGTVYFLEASALRKIAKALREFYSEQNGGGR